MNINIYLKTTFLFIFVFFNGCAWLFEPTHFRVPAEIMNKYKNVQVCCESFSDIKYDKLSIGKTVKIKIVTTFPAFNFETGKSYFLAYKLPDVEEPYEVEVRSYFMGTAFFPSMIVLDSEYRAKRFITYPEFDYQGPRDDWRGWVGGKAVFSDKDFDEKYILILTTDELMSRVRVSSQNGFTYWTPDGVGVAPGGDFVNHFGPTGRLKIITRTIESQ